jgi:hypothetical protein
MRLEQLAFKAFSVASKSTFSVASKRRRKMIFYFQRGFFSGHQKYEIIIFCNKKSYRKLVIFDGLHCAVKNNLFSVAVTIN